MSQRAATRGFFLCILAVLTALPATAQTNGGTITFPGTVTVAVGDTSDVITAQVVPPVGAGGFAGGTETLQFNAGDGLGYGLSTVPSTVTFQTVAGQTSATVRFRIAAEPFVYPGSFYSASVASTPTFARGTLTFAVEPFSIVPGSVSVTAGTTSDVLTATISFGEGYPQTPQQLVFTGLPDGAVPDPSPVTYTVPGQQFYAQVPFRIYADPSTTPGTYDVTVENTNVQVTPAASFVLVVEPGGSFTAAVEKPVLDVCPGGAAVANSVTVTPVEPYIGSPTVTFPGLPADLVITPLSFDIPELPPAQTVAFAVSARTGAALGSREVSMRVRDAWGITAVANFIVNIVSNGFTPVVAPAAVVLDAGGAAATVTASIVPVACGAPPASITVAPTGLPAGVTASPASAVISAPGYAPVTFSIVASGSVPAGVVSATFVFTPSTGAARTVPAAVTVVRPGRIGVALERASMDVCPGGGGAPNSLTITPLDGYVGAPTVTFPALPAGLTVVPAIIPVPAMPPAQTVAFSVSAAPGMAPGPVTVTALVSDPRGFGTTVTFIANLLPPAFTPSVAPSAVTLNGGGAAATITASLVAGGCAPTSNVTVTPSSLPPGVTVTPASAVLAPNAFAPAAFSFQASASAAAGPSTITFTFVTSVGTSKTATAVITVCGPPSAPVSPLIQPQGNANGPVTATDFLALGWGAPASGFVPARYEWRINGGAWTSVAGTSATAPPRGVVDPVQLFVRGYACVPERGPGAEASSPVYSLGPPVANFSVPASVIAGQAVTFTDTSSPQATSWLWFPGDGIPATTVQSPTVTFQASGPKVVVLVATNGSGTSSKTTTVNVLPASGLRAVGSRSVRSLEREPDGRLALGNVEVVAGATLLLRRIGGEGDAVAFLRLVDGDGRVVVERRLLLAAGEEARHDLSAFSTGVFRVELVGPEGLDAAVEELAIPFGGAEMPVTPRRPKTGGIR